MAIRQGRKALRKISGKHKAVRHIGRTYWSIRRPEARISAYKALIEAEKATRIHGSFSPGIIMDDIDCDGEKEVLYQASDMNCYIHEKGAAVFELDSFRNKHNYCCVYDLDEKRYPGCFIDRIFAANNFDKELHDLSTQLYSANERDQSPQKIIFSKDFAIREGTAHHSFTLKKSYFFQKYCISVDIEIINRSQCQVPLRYCSEVNIQPSANYEDVEYYAVDVREKQKIPAQLKPPLISAEAIIAQTIQGKELLEIRSDKLFQMQMEHFLDRLDTPQIIKLYDGPMALILQRLREKSCTKAQNFFSAGMLICQRIFGKVLPIASSSKLRPLPSLPSHVFFSYNNAMSAQSFPETMAGKHVHFIGAKGTGMAALAEILAAQGAILTGSDVPDVFYTDAIIKSIGMKVQESFNSLHIGSDIDIVIFSDAYSPVSNPEMAEAVKKELPMFSFAQALGALSRMSDSSGIAGVHGKTTTTAMTGSILASMQSPVTVLAGSAVSSFGGHCTLIAGAKYFVAETDEYKRHFMNFTPRRILLTSVESDHQDFYPTYEAIRQAFCDYVMLLPAGGLLIYCADDPGAVEVAEIAKSSRDNLRFVPYGFSAKGPWKIESLKMEEGRSSFRVGASERAFELHVPGKHLVLDAVGALALAVDIVLDQEIEKSHKRDDKPDVSEEQWERARSALAQFSGSRRRSEVIGEAGGVLVMDDYAHHPTALKATIAGIKEFWPSRRLVVDFMSHTYSRTIALMDDFAASLDDADCLVLHDIYASAREAPVEGVSGRTLFEKIKERRLDLVDVTNSPELSVNSMNTGSGFLLYEEKHQNAAARVYSLIKANDIFITMGAGDNWKLGKMIFEKLENKEKKHV